ncbi:MAG: helicase-exonuclease AddAB subunit AddA, partial [Limnochordia bacterium]|nr:helicase-exonuclease AddAB subunit AddA [Limnochordia bacterium]
MKIPSPWTKEQWEAISARNCDLLVSAAAGAGKTAVLVERISRLITDPQNPVDLNQLLVVTFTEAAAREMKERIGLKLTETLAHHPEDYRLAMQLTMLDSAAISTIHAFCLSIMRRYFYELELDPAFRVLDEAESILLRGELVDDLFNRLYREGDPRFIEVVDSFGGFDTDGALKAMVGQLYDFSRSMPDPAGWLDAALDNLDDLGLWQDLACKQMAMALTCLIEDYLYVQRLCQNHGLDRYGDLLSEELLLFDELRQSAQQDNWTLLTGLVEEVTFRTLPRVKDADQRVKEAVQAVRTEAKDLMARLRTEYLRPEGLGEELSRAKELMAIISNLVLQFGQSYREEKLRQGKVDFSDLEHYCLRLLRMPQIQRDLAGCYRYVLVDEYQDINGVQEEILNLCAQGADKFMVGDIKQSIYRFRLADPGLFLAKYERFTPEDTDKKRVDLSTNFRCQRQIINAVNYIFRQLFSKEVGELEYDLQAELVCGRQDASEPGTTKLHLVEGDVEDKELYPGIEAAHREALVMAAEIREMVGSLSVYDKGQRELRPATYSDIVILVRSMTHSDKILEAFDRCGIPAHVELSGGYFGATEVQTILSLLKVIDNPRQDIPLVAVLRSPIVGLTAEELGRLRIKSPETDFYDCLLEEGCGEKVQKFLEQLEDFRTVAQRCPLNQLIWHIYLETGYYDYVTGLPNGAQRRANLRALYDRALQFEEFS